MYVNITFMDGAQESTFIRDYDDAEACNDVLTIRGGNGSYAERGHHRCLPLVNIREWTVTENKRGE